MYGFESKKREEDWETKVKRAKWIAIILVCVVGCVYCNMQMKSREDSFKEDIIVTEGTIESMESVLAETSGRYSNNRNVVGMVNIDGELYEVTLTVNGKPEHSEGEVVTCYGYNGEYYIFEDAIVRQYVDNGGYFVGMQIFIWVPIILFIVWLIRRKKKK